MLSSFYERYYKLDILFLLIYTCVVNWNILKVVDINHEALRYERR